MSEATEACIRGCALRGKHLAECTGADDLERECRGCLPRRAQHGHLCWPCHRRLELMLHDAETVDRWLGAHLAGSTTMQIKEDFELSSTKDLPDVMRIHIYDQRQALRDQWREWVDDLCVRENLTGPKVRDVEHETAYLTQWLGRIEYWSDIAELWDYVADLVSQAHALAPWRPEPRRVSGVPCPGCGETNLIIFGGESDVTCGSCREMITEAQFGLWEQIVREERAGQVA